MGVRLPSVSDVLSGKDRPLSLDRNAIDAWLHLSSPRIRFLKSLPLGSSVLDVGAGDGALSVFRTWLEPQRPDLRIYAVSLERGAHFGNYDAVELVDLDRGDPDFGGRRFDAVHSVNLVEHIAGGIERLSRLAADRLVEGGLAYIEGPSPFMKQVPSRDVWREHGIEIACGSFYDDATHRDTISLDDMVRRTAKAGFFIEESGYIRNRFVEDQLLPLALAEGNPIYATFAVWMKYYVPQYLIAVRT
jgi:SAM-dependent methyltransferase